MFLIGATLAGIKWYRIVVFTCTSLMCNDVEHIFIYLLVFVYLWRKSSERFQPWEDSNCGGGVSASSHFLSANCILGTQSLETELYGS